MTYTARELEQYRLQAQALMEQRKREGTWSAGVQAHEAYQKRPLEWIVEYLGVPEHTLRWSLNSGYGQQHTWDGHKDPLVKILEALADWKDCGVEGATGPGKTFLAACIVYWFLACHENAIVSTIAPKEDQLLKHIWKEIGVLWPRFQRHFPEAELLPGTGVIRMRPAVEGREQWAASAFVCGVGASEEVATKAQGLHAEHLLIITEETPGINPAIMEALFNTRTDEHNLHLALGNPDHRNDPLHRFCFDEAEQPRPGVVHVRISALDHPNIVTGRRIVPGTLGRDRLARRIERLGKGTRLYDSRVRGICPAEAEDALIKWEWCVAAAKRWDDQRLRDGPPGLGADVADSPTGDKAAIAEGQGAVCLEVESWQIKRNAEEVAEKVFRRATDPERPIDPKHIGLDNVGVGASAYNALWRMGLKVRKVSGFKPVPFVEYQPSETGEEAPSRTLQRPRAIVETERFNSGRSLVWWRAREDLRLGQVGLPYDEELWQDLCTPTYSTRGGKIIVEAKEEVIKRLGRSPNKGDAFVYWNWVRPRTRPSRSIATDPLPLRKPNQEYGLERLLTKINKRQDAEKQQFERVLRKRRRAWLGRKR